MFEIKARDVQIEMSKIVNVEFIVKKVSGEAASCTLNDLSFISNDLSKADKTLMQFVDIATSQFINHYRYHLNSCGNFHENQWDNFYSTKSRKLYGE